MVIRAQSQEQVFELIPHERFRGDLPTSFVDNFVHWLNVGKSEVEFRPLGHLWDQVPGNWRLEFSPSGSSSMRLQNKTLLDAVSVVSIEICSILCPLETPEHIHITLSSGYLVEVHLPRYNLQFSVDANGNLESRELSAIVDSNQYSGTFIGLRNILILCGKVGDSGRRNRRMIVPYGELDISKDGQHVSINVRTSDQRQIRYFDFQIDTALSRLKGDGSLLANLYKAYLHGVTSFVLPDPFTGRTGTEEALQCLRRTQLWQPPDIDVIQVLNSIKRIAPMRSYYPKHLKRMQEIKWKKGLSPTAQHEGFEVLADEIFDGGQRMAPLYATLSHASHFVSRSHPELLSKARHRNSIFRSPDYGGNMDSFVQDKSYIPRDRGSLNKDGIRSHEIAALVKEWPSKLNITKDFKELMLRLGSVSGFGESFDATLYSDLLKICLSDKWGSLLGFSCRSVPSKKYQLMFVFSIIAFSESRLEYLRTLLAFAFSDNFRADVMPAKSSYDFAVGFQPDTTLLSQIEECTSSSALSEPSIRQLSRQERENRIQSQARIVYDLVMRQWPCSSPRVARNQELNLIDLREVETICRPKFRQWYDNLQFSEYLSRIDARLRPMYSERRPVRPTSIPETPFELQVRSRQIPDVSSHLPNLDNNLPTPPYLLRMPSTADLAFHSKECEELDSIMRNLESNTEDDRVKYAEDLRGSLNALRNFKDSRVPNKPSFSVAALHECQKRWERYLGDLLLNIRIKLSSKSSEWKLLELGGLVCRNTPQDLLDRLSRFTENDVTKPWNLHLIAYGEALALLQRSERMLRFAETSDFISFSREAFNPGRENWRATGRPQWLLIEIENNFSIRPEQARVAEEMLHPRSGRNQVLQLNMGEGKSSVIIPLLVTALADGMLLARVLVLKPLAKQMMDILSQRLGGLVNRPLYSTPFSRKTILSDDLPHLLRRTWDECINSRGVLLMQPQHVLSLKLVGIDRFADVSGIGHQMRGLYSWFRAKGRDVLDESDEVMDVRSELIYTMGSQHHMDGQPGRWTITQGILGLLDKHATHYGDHDRNSLEVNRHSPDSFPFLTFLKGEAWRPLTIAILRDVLDDSLLEICFGNFSSETRELAFKCMLDSHISEPDWTALRREFGEIAPQQLLLLRGLVCNDVLHFVICKKRFSVDYGPDLTRTMLAVPFRAKGVPSASAEFGHPDVAIVTTCLSYYYTGLSKEQLKAAFGLLFKSADPAQEYLGWVRKCQSLPNALRHLDSLNLDDEEQFDKQVFPVFRYNKCVIDSYLSGVVFPSEGRVFSHKLSTSAWDIPSELGLPLTTGFSGTNDNRYLLPKSIEQQDLPSLRHTNAMVLTYLLREVNRECICPTDPLGHPLSVQDLLAVLKNQDQNKPPIRVLIDVGAQILEMNNLEVARTWLTLDSTAEGAVYFSEVDELMVLGRTDHTEPLSTSSFRGRMDKLVVYLDESHTRGTDLKLPPSTRAAVMLGPRLTKDRLVQGTYYAHE